MEAIFYIGMIIVLCKLVDLWEYKLKHESEIEWHKYTQEDSPEVEGKYLITTQDGEVLIDEYWIDAMACDFDRQDVVAWAELPKPYKE